MLLSPPKTWSFQGLARADYFTHLLQIFYISFTNYLYQLECQWEPEARLGLWVQPRASIGLLKEIFQFRVDTLPSCDILIIVLATLPLPKALSICTLSYLLRLNEHVQTYTFSLFLSFIFWNVNFNPLSTNFT